MVHKTNLVNRTTTSIVGMKTALTRCLLFSLVFMFSFFILTFLLAVIIMETSIDVTISMFIYYCLHTCCISGMIKHTGIWPILARLLARILISVQRCKRRSEKTMCRVKIRHRFLNIWCRQLPGRFNCIVGILGQ